MQAVIEPVKTAREACYVVHYMGRDLIVWASSAKEARMRAVAKFNGREA